MCNLKRVLQQWKQRELTAQTQNSPSGMKRKWQNEELVWRHKEQHWRLTECGRYGTGSCEGKMPWLIEHPSNEGDGRCKNRFQLLRRDVCLNSKALGNPAGMLSRWSIVLIWLHLRSRLRCCGLKCASGTTKFIGQNPNLSASDWNCLQRSSLMM